MLRAIHPVSYHEKFVASGVYQTYFEGKRQDEVERWSIHELPDSSELIRVDRGDWRSESNMLVEVLRSANGHIQRCDIHWFQKPSPLKLSYIFFEGYVQISSDFDGKNPDTKEIELPAGMCILVPGYVNKREMLSSNAGEQTVFCIAPERNEYYHWMQIQVSSLDYLTGTAGGKSIEERAYLIETAGPTEEKSQAWASFDPYDILLKWADSAGNVLLTQYARRPEPKTS
jgi:hypothetical protein